jgi:small multidrug resistance pump
MKTMLVLFIAILCEVLATTCLKYSEGFTRLFPSVLVFLGYGASFYFLSISLKVLPIGMAYAIWSGVGIILTMIIGIIIWHERLDWIKGFGIFLIISGVALINIYSKTPAH